MIVYDNLHPDIADTSVALGFFDGIHIGHQKVLNSALKYSQKLGTKSLVLTYKNHPMELISGKKYEFITTPVERLSIFEKMGFDIVIMADFTKEISDISAENYFKNVILNLAPKSISIGYNHKFGAQKLGNAEFFIKNSQKFGFELSIAEQVKTDNDITVSSTYIKSLIKSGDVEIANNLLLTPYSLENFVIKGMQRGRELGFPTANIMFPPEKIIPQFGVYLGYTFIDGEKHPSIANVGMRPTFCDTKVPLTEINILYYDKNLYNKKIKFSFIKKLREEICFTSQKALVEQISDDVNNAIAFFKK